MLKFDEEKLTKGQLKALQLVREANLKAAFDEVLRERGIPLEVSEFRLVRTATDLMPDDWEWPPRGGCYCCEGRACYCCVP